MTKAVYAFSGDPITYGHVDIVDRAAQVFDELVVAIGTNPQKQYLFSMAERLQLTQKALQHIPNVQVTSFKGLLVDFAYELRADVIVKEVCNPTDFEYENSLYKLGLSQEINIDTFILLARAELAHISSSHVKQIQQDQGLTHDYVPINVKQALEAKMNQQYIVAVTGEIGAGKTYVCQRLVELSRAAGIPAHHIDLDEITHQIYQDLPQPRYQQVRQIIAQEFGSEVQKKDGTINRKVLGEIVFNDYQKLHTLNQIMQQPLMVRIRRELYGKKGLILLSAALIVESNMVHLVNNNVCLIKIDKKTQKQRLMDRDLSENQIQRRLQSQYTFQQKKEILLDIVEHENYGKMWLIDNSSDCSQQIQDQFQAMCDYFDLSEDKFDDQ